MAVLNALKSFFRWEPTPLPDQKKSLTESFNRTMGCAQKTLKTEDTKALEIARIALDDLKEQLDAYKLSFPEDKQVLQLVVQFEKTYHTVLQKILGVSQSALKRPKKDSDDEAPTQKKPRVVDKETTKTTSAPQGIVRGSTMNCFLIATYQLLKNAGLLSGITRERLAPWKDFDGNCNTLRDSFVAVKPELISSDYNVQEDATEVLGQLLDPSITNHSATSKNLSHQTPAMWDSITEQTFDAKKLPSQDRSNEAHSHKLEKNNPILKICLASKGSNQFEDLLNKRLDDHSKTTKDNAFKVTLHGKEYVKQLTGQKTIIVTPPHELFISFARFGYDTKTQSPQKNSAEVKDIPFELTLPEDHVQDHRSTHRYDLKGFIIHDGETCSSGHYYAVIRDAKGHWYRCDDEDVSRISSDNVQKLLPNAYVLHYSKKN